MKRARQRKRRLTKRRILAILVVAVLCTGTYAFTAALTVNNSTAADGAGVVTNSSYTISQIQYHLDASNPTTIADVMVTFSGGTPAGAVASIGGTWSSACSAAGSVFTCSFGTKPAFPLNDTTALRVVATS